MSIAFSNYGLCTILSVLSTGVNDYNKNEILKLCSDVKIETYKRDSCFSNILKIESGLPIERKFIQNASNYVQLPISYKRNDKNRDSVTLTSKMSFSCSWLHKFEPVGLQNFNHEKEVEMMSVNDNFHVMFVEEVNLYGVVLPFENENYKLLLFIPPYNEQKTANIDPIKFYNDVKDGELSPATIIMPKFLIKSQVDCADMVKSRIPTLFNTNETFEKIYADGSLEISELIQRVWLNVDEKGAESKIDTELELINRLGRINLVFDRPFDGYIIKTNDLLILNFTYLPRIYTSFLNKIPNLFIQVENMCNVVVKNKEVYEKAHLKNLESIIIIDALGIKMGGVYYRPEPMNVLKFLQTYRPREVLFPMLEYGNKTVFIQSTITDKNEILNMNITKTDDDDAEGGASSKEDVMPIDGKILVYENREYKYKIPTFDIKIKNMKGFVKRDSNVNTLNSADNQINDQVFDRKNGIYEVSFENRKISRLRSRLVVLRARTDRINPSTLQEVEDAEIEMGVLRKYSLKRRKY